jgi:ferredoxin-type protein NapH
MVKRQNIRKAFTISAFLLFPIIIFYFSPNLAVLGALEGVASGSIVLFILLFIFSLFLGRSLCGYICPVGGLQECMMLVNNKKAKGGKWDWIKYCLWGPWVVSIVVICIYTGGFKRIDFFYHTTNGVSLYEPFTYIIYYSVILLVVILALAAGRRAFCHYACWICPFATVGTKLANLLHISVLHIKADKTKCVNCGKCSQVCSMSLDVKSMVEKEKMANSECILCGECIDVCPKKVITYSLKK